MVVLSGGGLEHAVALPALAHTSFAPSGSPAVLRKSSQVPARSVQQCCEAMHAASILRCSTWKSAAHGMELADIQMHLFAGHSGMHLCAVVRGTHHLVVAVVVGLSQKRFTSWLTTRVVIPVTSLTADRRMTRIAAAEDSQGELRKVHNSPY